MWIMNKLEEEIKEMVDRETRAWDSQDIELLMSIFHPDMVWPWPVNPNSHDPMDWVLVWGRYDYDRWKNGWQDLFDTHKLAHNHREIRKILVSDEGDAGFAVVDIDTLWIHTVTGETNHWKGRVSKCFTLVNGEWKLIMHTGVLNYPPR